MEIYEIHLDHGSTSYTLGGGGPAWGYLAKDDKIFLWEQQWFKPKVYNRVFGKLDITVSDEGVWFLKFAPDVNGPCGGNCEWYSHSVGGEGENQAGYV